MNVTLSLDAKTVERARLLALERGTSLNQMIRNYLNTLAGGEPEPVLAELDRLWSVEEGDSRGWQWSRDEAHDRPVLR
jgi:Family of unknown function (DUF6364)